MAETEAQYAMITPKEAREKYGFTDCTQYEDNMTLGLYHAAQGWFLTPVMRVLDVMIPVIIAALIFAALFGMIALGPRPMLLMMAAGLSVAFIPQYWKVMQTRRDNSGLLHIESRQGNHFLTARGVCVKKNEEPDLSMKGRTIKRSLRVKMTNGTYLDNVLVIKELYDQIKEGASVSVIMADSDNAEQIIGAPSSFTNMVIDRKKVAVQQFAPANPGTIRELNEQERALYARQYEDRIALWKKEHQKMYLAAMAGFLAAGFVFLWIGLQAGTLLTWLISVYAAITLFMEMRDFRRKLRIIKESKPLTAVDVTVCREETYKESMGTKKTSASSVAFKDAGGAVLWTLRDAESIRTFLQGEKAILIVSGKEMIPLHRDTHQYTMQS